MIKFDEIENAFFYVSSNQPFMNSAVVNRITGKTYYQSDFAGTDEFPEDVESDDYIAIPHKNDLDLGTDLVFEFVSIFIPEKTSDVKEIFMSRGAYRRFKDFLLSIGQLEAWYNFEDEQTKKALRQWCKENDLDINEQ
jgi:hypothetical protein